MYLVGDHVGFSRDVKIDDRLTGRIVLGNLEGPLCDPSGKPGSRKAGPRVWNSAIADGPKWAFALANNHMMDFGVDGLRDTLAELDSKGIRHAGAGDDVFAARKAMVIEESGKRIGVISCAERQFGMADERSAGIAPMGDWIFGAVRDLRKSVDFVILSIHAAVEMSPIPSPELRGFYRALIDAGVDVVHGHHAHVPQGWERYGNGYIFYGLGNFLVDPSRWSVDKNVLWSLVVELDFSGDSVEAAVTPARICGKGGGVCVELKHGAYEGYIGKLNSVFADERLFKGAWQNVCVSLYHSLYEHNLGFYPIDGTRIGMRNWAKRLYHMAKTIWAFVKGGESSAYPLVQYNYVQCESHQKLIAEAMGLQLGCREDFRTAGSKELVASLLAEGEADGD